MEARNLLCLLILCGWFSESISGDWPGWLGPDANGVSEEVLPKEISLKRIWTAELGTGFSSFSVSEGRLYSMGHANGSETVWCLSAESGNVIWSDSYPAGLMPMLHEGGPGATPTVDGDRLFTISKDGQFRSYNASTGELLWSKDMVALSGLKKPPEWGFTGSPLIVGEKVLIEAGATYAFHKETGEQQWVSEIYRPAYGTPQLFEAEGESYLAVLKTDGLVIMNPDTGETLGFSMWRTSFQTNSTTPLVAGNGRLFISTGYDQGCALFRFSNNQLTKLYENKNMCNHMGNSVLIDGYLYGFDGTAHRGRPVEFTCMNLDTGEKAWHFQDLKYGSVIGAGRDLIVLTESGELLIGEASQKGFESRLRSQMIGGRCWTPPVLAHGVVYVRNADGTLVAARVD